MPPLDAPAHGTATWMAPAGLTLGMVLVAITLLGWTYTILWIPLLFGTVALSIWGLLHVWPKRQQPGLSFALAGLLTAVVAVLMEFVILD